MAGVGHHDCLWLGKIVSPEPRNPVRADGSSHSCASRTTPQRIAVGADGKRLCMSKHIGDGSREILCRHGGAGPSAVFEDRGVVPVLADRDRVRKAFMDGADV